MRMKQLYDKDWKKALIVVGIFLLFTFGLQNWNDNRLNVLKGEYNIISEQYESQKENVKSLELKRKKETDSLTKENLSLKQSRKDSETRYNRLEAEYNSRKKEYAINRERVKNLNNIEIAQELNDIYKTKDAVATDTSVNLNNNLPNHVLQTISDANECQQDIVTREKQIAEKNIQLDATKEELANTQVMLNSANNTIKADKVLKDAGEKNIENLKEQVNKYENKSTLEKIMIPAAAIGGFIIGNQLRK